MKPNKRIAGVLAGALAIAGAAAVMNPGTANAAGFTGPQAVACHLFFGSGLPGNPAGDASLAISNSTFEVASLSLSNYNPGVGETVTVTLTSTGGLTNGPVGLGIGGLTPKATVVLSGAQSGTVNLTSATPYPAAATSPYGNLGPLTVSGTFVAAGSGALSVAFRTLETFDNSLSGANNFCDGTAAGTNALPASTLANFPSNGTSYTSSNFVDDANTTDNISVSGFKVTRVAAGPTVEWVVPASWSPYSGPAVATAGVSAAGYSGITGTGSPVTSTSIVATGSVDARALTGIATSGQTTGTYGRSGQTITLTFNNGWTGGAGGTVELCNTGSTTAGCEPVGTVTVPASAVGSDTVLIPSGLTIGARNLVVTDPGATSSKRTSPYTVLGTRALTLSPASGGPGASISIGGSNFDTGSALTISGLTAASAATGDPTSSGSVSASGVPSGTYTVGSATTAIIRATEAAHDQSGQAEASFTVNLDRCKAQDAGVPNATGCDTQQNLDVTVTGGKLYQRAYKTGSANPSATAITFGSLVTPYVATTKNGTLNQIAVSDNRGGTYGWSLTAQLLDDFKTGAASTEKILKGQLTASPTCVVSTNATAYEYAAPPIVATANYDPDGPGPSGRVTYLQFAGLSNFVTGQSISVTIPNVVPGVPQNGVVNQTAVAVNAGPPFAVPFLTYNDSVTPAHGTVTGSGASTVITPVNLVIPGVADSVTPTPIIGFNDTLNAPGVTAGAANQPFSANVTLCTKNTDVNTSTQSTGGIYNVGAPLKLVVPAFQKAGVYTATMKITLV